MFRLTEPACLQYKQIVVLATRRKRHSKVTDAVLLDGVRYLEALATKASLSLWATLLRFVTKFLPRSRLY